MQHAKCSQTCGNLGRAPTVFYAQANALHCFIHSLVPGGVAESTRTQLKTRKRILHATYAVTCLVSKRDKDYFAATTDQLSKALRPYWMSASSWNNRFATSPVHALVRNMQGRAYAIRTPLEIKES
jgi:hypothetical protein